MQPLSGNLRPDLLKCPRSAIVFETAAMSKKWTPLWREAHFQVKMYKAHQRQTTVGSWDVEKVHAVMARGTFRCQTVQNTPFSDNFWKLRCRKSAHRCEGKHMSKSKCTRHTSSGLLLEVEVSKKCTPLLREAHVEVKSAKNWRVRSTFGRADVVLRGRRRGLCTLSKVRKAWGFCKKWSDVGVFCTFWLANVLRATTACNFFLLTLSLLWSSLFDSSPLWLFPPLLFHLCILSEVWLLNFLRTVFVDLLTVEYSCQQSPLVTEFHFQVVIPIASETSPKIVLNIYILSIPQISSKSQTKKSSDSPSIPHCFPWFSIVPHWFPLFSYYSPLIPIITTIIGYHSSTSSYWAYGTIRIWILKTF